MEAPHGISEVGSTASMMAAWLPPQRLMVPASFLQELTPVQALQAAASGMALVPAVYAPFLPPRVSALPAPQAMQRARTRDND